MDVTGNEVEIRAEDPKRFGRLRDLIRDDISDRKEWSDRAAKNRELRFATKSTKKPMYEGAPNIAEPLVDDLIRELKTAEVTLFWQAPKLAHFVGIDQAGVQHAAAAERAFDFHLRATGSARRRVAQIIDDKLCYGFGIAKLAEADGRSGLPVPEFLRVAPQSVVVPVATEEMPKAERVCHILRYTHAEFWREARKDGWDKNACRVALEKIAEKSGKAAGGGALSQLEDEEGGEARARWRNGTLPESHGTIALWEIYYETPDAGRRVCMICPDSPELPMYDRPWVWTAVRYEVPVQTYMGPTTALVFEPHVPVRPWPFVQFCNEDVDGFYSPRGVPEIAERDQKEASAYRTVRAIALDFCGKPFLSGSKSGSNPFKFRAGDYLGENAIVWAESPIQQQVYQQDFARNMAARRVGSPQGALSSTDQRREKKTATEVMRQTQIAGGMSADAVDRFAEPFADLFGQMWQMVSRSARMNEGKTGLVSQALLPLGAWQADYCISAGVSGRTANQWQTLQNMQGILPLIQAFPQVAQFVQAGPLGEWLFNLVDAELAKKVVVGSGGGAPIEQLVDQLGKVVGQHGRYLEDIARREVAAGAGGAGDVRQTV